MTSKDRNLVIVVISVCGLIGLGIGSGLAFYHNKNQPIYVQDKIAEVEVKNQPINVIPKPVNVIPKPVKQYKAKVLAVGSTNTEALVYCTDSDSTIIIFYDNVKICQDDIIVFRNPIEQKSETWYINGYDLYGPRRTYNVSNILVHNSL